MKISQNYEISMKIPILSEVHRKIFKLMNDITSYSKKNDNKICCLNIYKKYVASHV